MRMRVRTMSMSKDLTTTTLLSENMSYYDITFKITSKSKYEFPCKF